MKLRNFIITAIFGLSGILLSCDSVFNDVYDETNNPQVFISGTFSTIGGLSTNGFAGFDINSHEALIFRPEITASSSTKMIILSDTIYISENGSSLKSIDTNTGKIKTLLTTSGTIYALAADDKYIYMGGSFTDINSIPRNGFAMLDRFTGELSPIAPVINIGYIYSILVSKGIIYIGGDFTTVDGTSRSRFAAINSKTGKLTELNPAPNNTVHTITLWKNTLYIGGLFTNISSYIAAIDLSTGVLSSWAPVVTGSDVTAITATDDCVYIGTPVYGMNTGYNFVTAVDRIDGSVIWQTRLTATSNPNPGIFTIAIHEDEVFIGGYFETVSNQTRNNLAILDRNSGKLSSWNPNPNSNIYNILIKK